MTVSICNFEENIDDIIQGKKEEPYTGVVLYKKNNNYGLSIIDNHSISFGNILKDFNNIDDFSKLFSIVIRKRKLENINLL